MSTITCTNFFPKSNFSLLDDERYLIAVHGPFLEIYDLEKFYSDEFNSREYEPIRTRVFESSNVHFHAAFKDTGHVLAVTSEHTNKSLSIKACLIHREQLLTGGYVSKDSIHCLLEEPSRGVYFMAAIPNTNEILLLTEATLTHYRYQFDDGIDVNYEIVEEFEIQSLLTPLFTNRCITPLAVAGSSNYTFFVSVGNSIVLLKKEGRKWACREMQDPKISLLGDSQVMMIPDKEVAVIGGKYYIKFVSTSFYQSGVSKDQLRVIHSQFDVTETKAIASTIRNGTPLAYVIGDKYLTVWEIETKFCIPGTIFVHSSERVELRLLSKTKTTYQGGKMSHIMKKKNCTSAEVKKDSKKIHIEEDQNKEEDCCDNHMCEHHRIQYERSCPDIFNSSPISAAVIKRKMGSSVVELLVISYESGCVKIFKTDDIVKDGKATSILIGKKKMHVENLYPCWNFPLDPNTPLNRLIGLSNGTPILMELENGNWESKSIVPFRKGAYSHAKSRVSVQGKTVTVFYGRHDICFCLFDKKFRWKEDRLNVEIKECFISATVVVILTQTTMLFVDIMGLLDESSPFRSASIDYNALSYDKHTMDEIMSSNVRLMNYVSLKEDKILCCFHFSHGEPKCIGLTQWLIDIAISLQEAYDHPFEGGIMPVQATQTKHVLEMDTDAFGNLYRLGANGNITRSCGTNMIAYSFNLFDYIPKSARMTGFLSIQSENAGEGTLYLHAKEKEHGQYLYLKDVLTRDELTTEPIPLNFGEKHVFGHFIGPKEDGRCALYTTSSKGQCPELIRVEARVSLARNKETLRNAGSLFQPYSLVRLVYHKNSSNKPTTTIVTSFGNIIEIQEMNRKGRVSFKKEIELRSSDVPIFISSLNTFYVHSSHTLYIITGSYSGELTMITWDSFTNEHKCDYSIVEDSKIIENSKSKSAIRKVFFNDEDHYSEEPRLMFYLDDTAIRILEHDADLRKWKEVRTCTLKKIHSNSENRWDASDLFITCNSVSPGSYDIWMLSSEEALIISQGGHSSGQRCCSYSSNFSVGKIKSVSFLSTRTIETQGIHADFVFVVNKKGHIGVFACIQKKNSSYFLSQDIFFEDIYKSTKCKAMPIHSEIVNYSTQEPDRIEASIRLFIARKKSIKIILVKLALKGGSRESGSLSITEKRTIGEIRISTDNPRGLSVTSMEENNDRSAPKYALISGLKGTETVRICHKLLQDQSNNNESKDDHERSGSE